MLAVLISCFGMFSLAASLMEHRTKEIGVRKVLGASVFSLLKLISREFILLIAIANVAAWPAAWFIMNNWLQNYHYRINISLWMFLLSGFSALIIALLTVIYQVFRAACASPAEVLHFE